MEVGLGFVKYISTDKNTIVFFIFNFLACYLVESIFRAAKRFIYMRVLMEYLKEFSLELQLWNCGKGSRCGAVAIPLFETIFDWNDCRI